MKNKPTQQKKTHQKKDSKPHQTQPPNLSKQSSFQYIPSNQKQYTIKDYQANTDMIAEIF